MWQMTLKQRRRHSELMAQLDKLKRDKYLRVPAGYKAGINEEEDAKYKQAIETLAGIVDDIQALENQARDRS